MKLFSLFKSQYYKPEWVYKVDGQLWRILFTHGDFAAGEYRINEKKQVTFFSLDIRSGKEMWSMSRKGEGWWTTTEGVYGNKLYLHAFAKPDLPHPKHVTSVDLETGRILWEHPEYTFLYVKDDSVTVEHRKMEQTLCHRLDPETGEIRETIGNRETVEREKLQARDNDPHAKLKFPEMYNPQFDGHQSFSQAVSGIREKERLVDPIEVMEFNNNLLICYHKMKGAQKYDTSLLTHELVIYEKNKRAELYRDILYEDASAPVPDGFFVRENVLYYIRNKSELVAINLHTPQ